MHVEAFVLLKPGLHCRVFVRGVVVHDQVQLKMFGCFSIDLFEKFQPLLMPVLVLDATDQASLKIVQRSEQGHRAVANIIVRLRSDMADAKRESGLGALQGLNLTFFIAAEYQRLVWRIEVQPDHIPKFLFKVRIIGEFEGTCQMRLDVIGRPDSLDAGW